MLDQKQVTAAVQSQQRAAAEQQADRVQAEVDDFKKVQQTISDALAKQGLQGDALFSIDERGLVITIVTDSLVFGGNSAELLSGGEKILDVAVPPLLGFPNAIEVDGHTNQDNVSTVPLSERVGAVLGPRQFGRPLPGQQVRVPAIAPIGRRVLRPEAALPGDRSQGPDAEPAGRHRRPFDPQRG